MINSAHGFGARIIFVNAFCSKFAVSQKNLLYVTYTHMCTMIIKIYIHTY